MLKNGDFGLKISKVNDEIVLFLYQLSNQPLIFTLRLFKMIVIVRPIYHSDIFTMFFNNHQLIHFAILSFYFTFTTLFVLILAKMFIFSLSRY